MLLQCAGAPTEPVNNSRKRADIEEALVLGEMQVQDVQLDRGHAVEIPLDRRRDSSRRGSLRAAPRDRIPPSHVEEPCASYKPCC
jgi:hypothetical protein